MRRLNSDGIRREDLLIALRNDYTVRTAVSTCKCMLCRGGGVNSAGLCEGCTASLNDAELEAARPWIEGRRV